MGSFCERAGTSENERLGSILAGIGRLRDRTAEIMPFDASTRMIGHATATPPYPASSPFQNKRLSPLQAAEKGRIEARLEVLEKKMNQEKATGLDPAELDQRTRLQSRDAEVKTHEKAHQAAAGGLSSGGMSLVYQTGPDGRAYAVGGSVQIDTSEGRTPEETIQKARKVRAAALAPSDPSSTDIKVAARASQMEAQAMAELAQKGKGDSRSENEITSSKQIAFFEAEDEVSESEDADNEAESKVGRAASVYEQVARSYR